MEKITRKRAVQLINRKCVKYLESGVFDLTDKDLTGTEKDGYKQFEAFLEFIEGNGACNIMYIHIYIKSDLVKGDCSGDNPHIDWEHEVASAEFSVRMEDS
mgnify:FL=1